MSRWRDLIGGDGDIRLYEGVVSEDVAELTEMMEIIIPAFDEEQPWPAAPWMPRFRVLPDGALDLYLPKAGDRCCVGLAETPDAGEPEIWVLAWWPSD